MIRSTLAGLFARQWVEDLLAEHNFVRASDLVDLREEVARLREASAGTPDTDLTAEVAALKKKLNMTMGAIQASTASLMSTKATADEAHQIASRADQRASSANVAAEAAADGVSGVEERLAALVEKLGTPAKPKAKKRTATSKTSKKKTSTPKKTAAKK
jgi:ABC-type Na+ efflux pump permease subunit